MQGLRMQGRVVDGQAQLLRDGQEPVVGRHKDQLHPDRQCWERDSTCQLDRVISTKRIRQKEIHGLMDYRRLRRDPGIARGEFPPECAQRLISLWRASFSDPESSPFLVEIDEGLPMLLTPPPVVASVRGGELRARLGVVARSDSRGSAAAAARCPAAPSRPSAASGRC